MRVTINVICFIFLLLSTSHVLANNPNIESILKKIDVRHSEWISIRANLTIYFSSKNDVKASCNGKLLYNRLDEKILLKCSDVKDQLVFVFKAADSEFDLYIPEKKTIFKSTIFDLENSPEIESHLKPLDLYRALKPMTFDPKRTDIEKKHSSLGETLYVYGKNLEKRYLSRSLIVTEKGEVLEEIYYSFNEIPITKIERFAFEKIFAEEANSKISFFFPKKIKVQSIPENKTSVFIFEKVTPLFSFKKEDWEFTPSSDTKTVVLKS